MPHSPPAGRRIEGNRTGRVSYQKLGGEEGPWRKAGRPFGSSKKSLAMLLLPNIVKNYRLLYYQE
jgi:hypothetical protein